MTNLPVPHALLFDWDGTLIDNWDAIVAGTNDALAAFGKPTWSREEAMNRISASQRDSFPKLFGDDWERARDIFYEGFLREHLTLLTVLEGAEELLDANADLPMALVSNKHGDFLRKEAAYLDWTNRFAIILGAMDAEHDKPDPAPVYMALNAMDLQANGHIWFIGDSHTDMATARAAGCTSVLVTHPAANPAPIPEELAPDLSVPDLTTLREVLAGIRPGT